MAGKYLHPDHNATPPTVEQLACVKCGGSLTLRAKGYSTTLICPYCNALYDVGVKGLTLAGLAPHRAPIEPLIPLGTRGKLHGATWEVIGFMQRRSSLQINWQEYLLFNPYKGFRWLTECQGHWNYVLSLHETPKTQSGNRVSYLDESYRFYDTYQATVQYVIGEFYWQVNIRENCTITDYICVPNILTLEKPQGEIVWSLAEYIEPETIQAAFGITKRLPTKIGASVNQPFKRANELTGIITAGVLGAVVLTLFTMMFSIFSSHRTLAVGELIATPDTSVPTYSAVMPSILPSVPVVAADYISPTFEITDDKAILTFTIYAPVDNSWVDLEAKLINEETGKTLYFEDGVEYYHGYDSDGSWSEGSRQDKLIFSALPKGKYHLVIQATTATRPSIPVKYQFKQGGVSNGSYFMTLILLLLPSIAGIGYYYYFNYNRSIS